MPSRGKDPGDTAAKGGRMRVLGRERAVGFWLLAFGQTEVGAKVNVEVEEVRG